MIFFKHGQDFLVYVVRACGNADTMDETFENERLDCFEVGLLRFYRQAREAAAKKCGFSPCALGGDSFKILRDYPGYFPRRYGPNLAGDFILVTKYTGEWASFVRYKERYSIIFFHEFIKTIRVYFCRM